MTRCWGHRALPGMRAQLFFNQTGLSGYSQANDLTATRNRKSHRTEQTGKKDNGHIPRPNQRRFQVRAWQPKAQVGQWVVDLNLGKKASTQESGLNRVAQIKMAWGWNPAQKVDMSKKAGLQSTGESGSSMVTVVCPLPCWRQTLSASGGADNGWQAVMTHQSKVKPWDY